MPTVVFHVTSARNRKSILQHGLDWRRMLDQPGIAGSPSAEGACVFLADDSLCTTEPIPPERLRLVRKDV